MAWSVVTVSRPAEDPSAESTYTYVTVSPGKVGSAIQLNTIAAWSTAPIASNRASGVVTQVSTGPGTEVSQGATLYAVDLHPVVIAKGDTPAFRSIGDGSKGDDVRQLQQLLSDLGFYNGEIGGEAGSRTVAAIRAWQKSQGVEQTGTVSPGDVIYVPTLPTRVSLDEKLVYRGASLSGGEAVLLGLPASPLFTIPATDAQAALMTVGKRVNITAPDGGQWVGAISDQKRDSTTNSISVSVVGADGATVCGDQCNQIPVTGQATLASSIVTVEDVSGLVVPSAAIVSAADGSLALIGEDGGRIPVTVSASARGMSVVSGVEQGVKVRVPGNTSR
ncbi:peptidoglycan-binding protein [Microbacterium sp. VKM Ac-2870]|nr:peptidoglycan-binding protein [Microbacterium sp. VKM Ac-2870]